MKHTQMDIFAIFFDFFILCLGSPLNSQQLIVSGSPLRPQQLILSVRFPFNGQQLTVSGSHLSSLERLPVRLAVRQNLLSSVTPLANQSAENLSFCFCPFVFPCGDGD